MTRTSIIGGDSVTVAVTFNLLPSASNTPIVLGDVTVDISSNITNPRVTSTTYNYGLANQNGAIPGSSITKNNPNITTVIPAGWSASTYTHQISIVGKNTLEVSNSN